MSVVDLLALSPMLVLAAAAIVGTLAAGFARDHRLAAAIAVVGLALATLATVPAMLVSPRQVTALVVTDGFGLFIAALLCGASLVVALLAYDDLRRRAIVSEVTRPEEFYVLLLLATLGAVVLAASSHFASFFLGLEVLSVSLYGLIAYPRLRLAAIEAGVKYLILAATSAAFLLFGMALIYGELGTMHFGEMAVRWTGGLTPAPVLATGIALIIVGMGFKLAVVPFHLWTPDVYQGAPAPVASLVATVSKGAMFALLVRYFNQTAFDLWPAVLTVFALIAVASMFVGNLLALRQENVKRLLAYSSIAHMGYLLVAFLAGGSLGIVAIAYYLVAYFVTTLAAFGVVTLVSTGPAEAERLEDYRGLAWRRPWLAGAMTAAMLSLTGIPLTAGFIGKFYIVAAGVQSNLWWLVLILLINSAISLYYYLRVVAVMYLRQERPAEEEIAWAAAVQPGMLGGLAVGVMTALMIWLGVAPATFTTIIAWFATGG